MKKKWFIKVSDVPHNSTIEKYILKATDLNKYINKLSPKFSSDYLSSGLNLDQEKIKFQVNELLKKYQSYSFQYNSRESQFASYTSTSLTFNTNAIDNISNDPQQSGLGSNIYSSGNAHFYENIEALKNSYADTYSFHERTPISQEGLLKSLLDSFKRTLIRSRISTIKANCNESTDLKYLWHQDESIFLNLRVNVPIQSNENYVIQFLSEKANEAAEISEFHLEPGKAYVYDTQKYHRPFCKKLNDSDRINIICGVSPWFDYDREKNQWCSNEFYGELHPFEMFQNGYVSSLIGK
jgi:hypothetical protein